jgi:uncharacterized protein
MIRRVVLDTSTLVSAAIRIGSKPHRAMMHAFATCEVCASAETLGELEHVLERPAWDAYADRDSLRDFAAVYRRNVRFFSVEEADRLAVEPHCRDPRDNEFLALAVAAEADVLVSSDQDLLVMHPWRGIPSLTPADFLSSLDQP